MTWGTSSGNSSSVPPPPLIRLPDIRELAARLEEVPEESEKEKETKEDL
jgi:hypothetical protein